eukprot:Mrub_00195.p1 GENE.Mrub_00195~~Mrub_00195.p1  ORF type:complete len:1363 (-),score=154.37 Mrub_00195:189-3848(-)
MNEEEPLEFIYKLKDDLSINTLMLYVEYTEMLINLYDSSFGLVNKHAITMKSNKNNASVQQEPDQFHTFMVSQDVKYIQFLVNKFEKIHFIGFINTLIDLKHFNLSFYDNMHYLLADPIYNVKVFMNNQCVDTEQIYDNKIKYKIEYESNLSENTTEFNQSEFETEISMFTQSFFDHQLADKNVDHPFKLIIEQDAYTSMDKKLYLFFSKYEAVDNKLINLSEYSDSKSSPVNMSQIIELINTQDYEDSNVLIKIDTGSPLEFLFAKEIKYFTFMSVFKMEDDYAVNHIRDHIDNSYDFKYDLYSLTLAYMQTPLYVEKLYGDLYMMESRHKTVVDSHYYQVSGYKDDLRQKATCRSFIGIVFTNFEACFKLIRPYGEFFTKLFVNYNYIMSNGPFVKKGNLLYKIPQGQNRSMYDLNEKPKDSVPDNKITLNGTGNLNTEASESDLDATQKLEKKLFSKRSLNDFIKARISQAVKPMKMFVNFNPETEDNFTYLRLIGFMAFFYANRVLADFVANKNYLNSYFNTKIKYVEKMTLNHEFVLQPVIKNHIVSLPMNYKYILFLVTNRYSDIEFDYKFDFGNWTLFVCIEKRVVFCNSPLSYLYPLPVILEFTNFSDQEDLPQQYKEFTNRQISELEDYLKAYVDPEGYNLAKFIKPNFINDIIHNSYFKVFNWSNSLRLNITSFFKASEVIDETYRLLQSFKIYDFTTDMSKNSQFKLIRYSRITATFEVFKEHYNEYDPGSVCMYADFYTPKYITDYKIKNEETTVASAIYKVSGYVANREFHMMDYLKALYGNIDDYSIYDIEFIRDMIDYEYFSYVYYVYWIYVLMYVADVVLICYFILTYIPLTTKNGSVDATQLGYVKTCSEIIMYTELLFLFKVILDVLVYNRFMNYEVGFNYFITFMNNIVVQMLFSEKVIDLLKTTSVLFTAYNINSCIINDTFPDYITMLTMIFTLFIIFINFINFLKYLIVTQKLIVVIIEIIKDLGYTMFIALVMVIALTMAMFGIELFKASLLNMTELQTLDPDSDYDFMPLVDILINTISLAFLADNSNIEGYKNIIGLLKHDNIDSYPDLKASIKQLEIFSYLIDILYLIVIFFYIIILLNFVIAVMSDTYARVNDNIIQYTYSLKANILLEYAWFSELRIACLSNDSKYVLPYKLKLDEGDDGGDGMEELIEGVKKHTALTIEPVNNNTEQLIDVIRSLEERIAKIAEKVGVKE